MLKDLHIFTRKFHRDIFTRKFHWDTGYPRGMSKPKQTNTSEKIQDPHKYYCIPRESIHLKAWKLSCDTHLSIEESCKPSIPTHRIKTLNLLLVQFHLFLKSFDISFSLVIECLYVFLICINNTNKLLLQISEVTDKVTKKSRWNDVQWTQ